MQKKAQKIEFNTLVIILIVIAAIVVLTIALTSIFNRLFK